MQHTRYDVTVPKKYTKDGEEKTAWNRVGTLVKFEATADKPESYLLELSMFPETKFGVFESKPRDAAPATDDTEKPPF
jgi:hypothetical protein